MTNSIAMRDAVLRALLPYLSDARAGRAALRVCEAVAPYIAAQAIEAGTAKTEGLGPKDESAVTK